MSACKVGQCSINPLAAGIGHSAAAKSNQAAPEEFKMLRIKSIELEEPIPLGQWRCAASSKNAEAKFAP